jgi:tetratricopeptide (TPR) repeat protein
MKKVLAVLLLTVSAAAAENLEEAVNALKAFEGKGDVAAVPMAVALHQAAAKELAAPKPEAEDAAKAWEERREYLRQVSAYAEFALMNQAVKASNPAESAAAAEALVSVNPKSSYSTQAANAAFLQLRQANQMDQAAAFAEKILPLDPGNEEMLLVTADHFMKKNEGEKVLRYSQQLIEAVRAKAKPDSVTDADWEKRKGTLLSAALWMEGVTFAGQNKFTDANRTLREALPILSDEQMKAAALFHLGVANFRLGEGGKAPNLPQLQESMSFSAQCAAIKGPYSGNCAKNMLAVQQKYKFRK